VCPSGWAPVPLELLLAARAQQLVGGPDAGLIIDDTTLVKQGQHSVGVARQYSGAAGKHCTCQTLVSLTLACGEVPVGVALRLFLPREWTSDPGCCRAAGVPEERLTGQSTGALARAEVDRLLAARVTFGCVLADAVYARSAGA
jgi:SRSO17 transposase